jgi:hypothetical protein
VFRSAVLPRRAGAVASADYGGGMGDDPDATAGNSGREVALARARGDRWLPDQPVTSIDEAARYVADVGFALLFPAARADAPSLWEAVAGPDAVPFADGMGPAESKVWAWKDDLPKAGLAWYGKFVCRRASLLSPRLLAALYPGVGEPTDHEAFALPEEAHSIAEALLPGPLPSAALREIISDRRRYDRAITALQRHLLVTSAGVHEYGTGWPATVIDLTCRLFDVGRQLDYSYAAGCFLDTMVDATPGELARAYGWPAATARTQLDALR